MAEKIDLSPKAEAVLMTARLKIANPKGHDWWTIERTLGWRTWKSGGREGKRADVAELYRLGLVKEWFSPWEPPLLLTPSGLEQYLLRVAA